MGKKFTGVITALITPFKNGVLDRESFRRLVNFQVESGIQGFVVNGTTGESPTVSGDEAQVLFDDLKRTVGNSVPVLVGTGSSCTKKTIEATRQAEAWGADGALIVTPYYNKPPQRGLVAHYRSVAENTKIPIVAYNVPSRTAVALAADSVIEISRIRNIVGLKEASGQLDLFRQCEERAPEDFTWTSGDDDSCVEFSAAGGDGVISVISHLIPRELVMYMAKAKAGDREAVTDYRTRFLSLLKTVYAETNPLGVKMALYKMGLISSPEVRLPLVEFAPNRSKELELVLKSLGLGMR